VPTCRDVSELVTDYLDRNLSMVGWLGVSWHLLQCDACRHYVAQMRQTIRLLTEGAFPPPQTETEDRVLQGLRGEASPNLAPGD
jgi:predicted anti-sigma-YlaC factor YlaD